MISTKSNFWEKLQPYKAESYLGDSLAPLVAVTILKLLDAKESTSMESIAVTAFKLFPDKFSMPQFSQYPDYMRTFTSVRMHLKEYVEGNMKKNSFILNGKGKIFAEKALEKIESGKSSSPKKDSKRKKNTRLIFAVPQTDGYKKFKESNFDEIKKFDICETLHCTTEASDEHLRSNLATLQHMATEIESNLSYKETAEQVLKYLTYIDDNWEMLIK
ncbi:MAG: hypothetical protein HOD60_03710 [Candidatus Nitrosopelagicus sp.]|nr:hypothetical protein [Candidatus Nitrosopelagicus sp.]